MSRDQGRKGTSNKGTGGSARGPAATRRRGLLVFGVLFLVLFVVVAVSEGVGDPSIPSGDVVLVEDTPGEVGKISEERFQRALEQAASQDGGKKTPKPGDPKYDEVKETALNFILEGVWIQGIADQWGISVTEDEVAAQLEKVKEENFPSKAQFKEFLNETHYTIPDINERIEVELLSEKLQEQLQEKAPKPSQSEIDAYYEAAKATQFTQKPSRDVRMVVNKDSKNAQEAFDALSKDNTAKNWSKVAKEYSEDPSKGSGGLQKGLQEGIIEEPLNAAVFSTPEGRIEGPIKAPRGYTVFEVVNSTPESVQELKAVEGQIKSTMEQRLQQEYFTTFVSEFQAEWQQRTFCAPDYTTERCANFKKGGRPAAAPEACYEADPKGGLPEACPAPVFQLIPALPGTVTPLEPAGKALPQRPQPIDDGGQGAAESAPGLPEGAAPPGGEEAPPEEAPAESE